jgi:hypothetical protein
VGAGIRAIVIVRGRRSLSPAGRAPWRLPSRPARHARRPRPPLTLEQEAACTWRAGGSRAGAIAAGKRRGRPSQVAGHGRWVGSSSRLQPGPMDTPRAGPTRASSCGPPHPWHRHALQVPSGFPFGGPRPGYPPAAAASAAGGLGVTPRPQVADLRRFRFLTTPGPGPPGPGSQRGSDEKGKLPGTRTWRPFSGGCGDQSELGRAEARREPRGGGERRRGIQTGPRGPQDASGPKGRLMARIAPLAVLSPSRGSYESESLRRIRVGPLRRPRRTLQAATQPK